MKFSIDVLGVFLKIVIRINRDTFAPLVVSTLFILLTSILAHCARRLVQNIVKDPFVRLLFEEAIAAAELCGCCFELIVVADNFGVATYAVYLFALTIWWSLNWGDATACPYTHIEDVIEGRGDVRKAILKTWAELGGGMLVFKYVQMYWALEISDTHKDKAVEDCSADLQVPVLYGALVEGIATCLCRLASRALGDLNPRFATAIDAFIGTSLVVADKTDVIQCAVPIDIDTEKPGKTVRPIFMFIPYKKPLLSRKYYVNDPRYEREDIHNYQKVKVQDSDYIDYLDFPFVRAQSKHHPPSVGHGADIFFGQAKVAKKIFGHLMNDDVMEALKRWQYDNRGKTKVLM